jgi:hypothetical protein
MYSIFQIFLVNVFPKGIADSTKGFILLAVEGKEGKFEPDGDF